MFKNLIFNLKVLHFNKWQCIIIFTWLHISNLWMTLQHLIQYQQLSLHWILEKCLLFLAFYCKVCMSTWLGLWVRRYFYTYYIWLYLQCSPTLWESFIQFTENQNRKKKKAEGRISLCLTGWTGTWVFCPLLGTYTTSIWFSGLQIQAGTTSTNDRWWNFFSFILAWTNSHKGAFSRQIQITMVASLENLGYYTNRSPQAKAFCKVLGEISPGAHFPESRNSLPWHFEDVILGKSYSCIS